MAETWYVTNPYRDGIAVASVERSTESSVWINGRRVHRITAFDRYFPTWDEAREHLEDTARNKVNRLRVDLSYAERKLEHIENMVRPVEQR